MLTEKQEQKLMTSILKSAKDRSTKTEIGGNKFFTFNEYNIREFALDIFRDIGGIIK